MLTGIRFSKVKTFIIQIHNRYMSLSDDQKPFALFFVVLFTILSLILFYKSVEIIVMHVQKQPPKPLLIRQSNDIVIPETSSLRTQLLIQQVSTSNTPHQVTFPSIVEADPTFTVNVQPSFAGRLVQLHVNLGDDIKKNQLVAVIRSPGQAFAYSDHDKAKSALDYAKESLNRAKKVNLAGANAIKDIQLAESNYKQAYAEYKRTLAVLKASGKNGFSLLKIKAPMDGKITALNYGIGTFINDPTTTLMTITNINSLFVSACIFENYIKFIKPYQQVVLSMYAYPKETIQGTITSINSVLNPTNRCALARIRINNNDHKLKPNMFGIAAIAIPEPHMVLIPLSAILMKNDSPTVFVEIAPWTFSRRIVELGMEDDDHVRIVSGLHIGERIIINGGVLVNDY